MTLQEFYQMLEKYNIDLGDFLFTYVDSKTDEPFYNMMSEDDYDTFVFDCLENYSNEIKYEYSFISDDFNIAIDMNSVKKVLKKYYPNIILN